jgi:phytoene dehydrogenase-like protein
MAEKSIAIIGAGLTGLATGCYAQMNGYRTRIYERHTRAGGACTAWKRKGYTIDGCIRWLSGGRPGARDHQLYREVGALQGNRLLPLDRLAWLVDEAGGQRLQVTADLDRLAADLEALSPEDGQVIDELLAGVRAFGERERTVDRPREWMGPLARLRRTWALRRPLLRLARYNVSAAAFAKRFSSPFLRWAVANVCTPQVTMTALLTLLARLVAGELATVEGGSLAFTLAIARRYVALGGQLFYGAAVKEILVEHDRAIGVRLADGSTHRADVVVSAAGGDGAHFYMRGGRYAGAAIRKRRRDGPPHRGLLLISYGLAHVFPGQAVETVLRLRRPLLTVDRPVERMRYRVSNATLAPAGKAVVQAFLETDVDYWHALHQDRARYEAQKTRITGEVLERLAAHLPGLSAHVEMTDVATPYTWWRYTRCDNCAFAGGLPTPEHGRGPLSRALPGLRNAYVAGQRGQPGGIPAALRSGRRVVQILCHRDGTPFSVSADL